MSYSALFTSGLSLASQPRPEPEAQAASRSHSLHINVQLATPRPRWRKRRSSMTVGPSPMSPVKSPLRDVLRANFRSPRESSFSEAAQLNGKPRAPRRKTTSSPVEPPSLPAPTTPLPSLPTEFFPTTLNFPTSLNSSIPFTFFNTASPASPITLESISVSIRPSRKSSDLLPLRTPNTTGREPLSPRSYAANRRPDSHPGVTVAEKKNVPSTVWFDDDDEDMKENGSDS